METVQKTAALRLIEQHTPAQGLSPAEDFAAAVLDRLRLELAAMPDARGKTVAGFTVLRRPR